MQTLTPEQTNFLEEIQTAFENINWSVSSYPKHLAPGSTWSAFKFQLIDFCLQNNLHFLEKSMFFHVGRSLNICELADVKLNEHLSEKPLPASMVANQTENSLN